MRLAAIPLLLLAPMVQAESLRIGVTTDYPPYIVTYPDGTRVGFDADLADAICAMGGYDCTWVDLPFSGLFPALQAGRVDIVMGGIARTAERDEFVDFTCLYDVAEDNDAWLYTRDPTSPIEGIKVAVVGGSLYDLAAQDAGFATRPYPNQQSARDAIQSGAAGGLVDAPGLDSVETGLHFRLMVPMQDAGAAIVVSEDRPALRDALNGHLATLSASGELGQMQLFWFEADQGDIVAECARPLMTS